MKLAIFVVAVCGLLAAPAQAQDVGPPSIPPGEDQIEALSLGARAPFEGMLLSTDTSIRWVNRLRWWREAFRLRVEQNEELLTAVRNSHSREIDVVRGSYEREIDGLRADIRRTVALYERQLERYRDPPFYKEWGFAFGVGVVLVGAIVGITAGVAASL